MKFIRRLSIALALAILTAPSGAWACAACFGKSDSTMAKSINAGIFSLMGVVGVVLAGAASFFVFLSRRAAAASSETANDSSHN